MTYQFGISEKVKERVEECGRVELTDLQAMKLYKTRALSIFFVTIGIGALGFARHTV